MGVEEDFLKDNLDDGYDLENETQQPDNRADTKTRPTSRVLLSYQQAFSLNALNMFGTGHMAALPSTRVNCCRLETREHISRVRSYVLI